MQLRDVQNKWIDSLKHLYEEREVRNIFQLMLDDVFGITKSDYLTNQVVVSIDMSTQLDEILGRLQKGEPAQQIIGFTYFDGLKIALNEHVLIPRPETEELIHWIQSLNLHETVKFIDLCSGSGCIALALKNHYRLAQVIGVDVSKQAVAVADKNASDLALAVDFFLDDVLSMSQLPIDADCVVSNPPYIPNHERTMIASNVLEYEPELALFVPNENPLLFYQKIAELTKVNATKTRYLLVEIHERFADEVCALFAEMGFHDVEQKLDLQGKARMVKGILN